MSRKQQASRGPRFGRGGGGVLLQALFASALGLGSLTACGAEPAGSEAHADEAQPPGLQILGLDGQPYDVDSSAEPTVLLFVGRVCPISNALVPEMKRIYGDYAGRGVDFRLVYTDADESLEDLRTHLSEYDFGMPAVLDFSQQLVKRFGLSVTPEVALVLADGSLAYRGRINDLYADFGVQRSEPTRHDLRLALDAVLDGKEPDLARTEAIGCVLPETIE